MNTIAINPIEIQLGTYWVDYYCGARSFEVTKYIERELNLLAVQTMKLITRETYTWNYKRVEKKPFFLFRLFGAKSTFSDKPDRFTEGTTSYGYIYMGNDSICIPAEDYPAVLAAFRGIGSTTNIENIVGDVTVC